MIHSTIKHTTQRWLFKRQLGKLPRLLFLFLLFSINFICTHENTTISRFDIEKKEEHREEHREENREENLEENLEEYEDFRNGFYYHHPDFAFFNGFLSHSLRWLIPLELYQVKKILQNINHWSKLVVSCVDSYVIPHAIDVDHIYLFATDPSPPNIT